MAASFVDQANTGADSFETSRSVSKPGGVSTDDVGVLYLSRWENANSFPAVTAPGGSVLRSTNVLQAGGSSWQETLTYLIYTGAESSYAFSWTGSRWSSLSSLFFTGVDTELDLSTVPFNAATATSTTSVPSMSVTTVVDAALAWHVNTAAYTSAGTHAPPTDFTEPTGADADPWATAYRISPGTGSQSASGATTSVSQPGITAVLLALAPVAGDATASPAVIATTVAVPQVASAGEPGAPPSLFVVRSNLRLR